MNEPMLKISDDIRAGIQRLQGTANFSMAVDAIEKLGLEGASNQHLFVESKHGELPEGDFVVSLSTFVSPDIGAENRHVTVVVDLFQAEEDGQGSGLELPEGMVAKVVPTLEWYSALERLGSAVEGPLGWGVSMTVEVDDTGLRTVARLPIPAPPGAVAAFTAVTGVRLVKYSDEDKEQRVPLYSMVIDRSETGKIWASASTNVAAVPSRALLQTLVDGGWSVIRMGIMPSQELAP